MQKVVNITVAGLGGQGVLTVTDIIAEVMFRAGFDVKKSEVHGMSQRGGSVSSEVRYGKEVASPMVPEGESDFLIVMEPTQVEVNRHKLKAGGVLITTDDVPMDKLTNPKALNTMMLGALSKHLELADESWLAVIKERLPEKLHALNIEMFELGRNA
ncbi:indolepyruvate oxidoreductase subunit beta [Victivallis vadensis]|jgi:pyruvate/ketoisovalerate oxidoreductase|uniref:Indolepyruvate ferredoxin oxidoreductase beta subunit n=1 Tax=Victivallis vadensis TaxID=172901 RepID=A0A2U1BBC5_9BACT|nr:indolepyruvate oxidoreductase subunit beta [Victivallis vadensis]NMD87614.1 indolepyruvate oxidoreductase subunit beta [Victivallis vadensis]PVY45953.1 indolepyruvate ferredoxin oxidoreductase beta subunit [Victivallis vadensis]PWM75741.1 MAG: pyruvate ferredoxin oxidoreductase [Lentisphaerota bacterium]HJH05490.1 indolepyruvate oxidoreductase subunit beta [Victivallis vadensis]